MVSNSIHGIGEATVTIVWSPPMGGGNNVQYTIGATPVPPSGPMPVTTTATQTNITVSYNTNYTVTVRVSTCAGELQAMGTVFIG